MEPDLPTVKGKKDWQYLLKMNKDLDKYEVHR
jgi:hypothetical protein